ncbi:MobP3 family relaxase [Anaerotignum lactatifermentans]|uniref:MobP3 family relaxase n=1 Tax=Anaerotignum lactatifermentans TaxID=160404 RepID=UPI0026762F82|nr:MobP3 family relaxase [Anaerotignum lactatifermentans]
MPRLVFTPRYLKMQKPSQVKNYVKYVATRPNAEKFEVDQSQTEATEHQKKWIEKELKAHKELKESCEQEYEDYLQNPTRENAAELINKIAEEGLAREGSMENYVGYLAKRPRAERGKQGHALWNGSDKEIDLNQVAREAAEHNGNIWTFVLSLKREDAVRLGYDQANTWRELVRSKSDEIAKAMWIPTENFVWYGAFHNEGHHPHIHLMCYSKNPKEGYLGRQNLMKLRSSFANEIFRDELYHIYEQKDEVRDELKKYFDRKLKQAMAMEDTDHPKAEALLWELSQKLKTAKHKKVYGRLEKENKILVDEIVKEISKDKKISKAYESWLGLKDDILSTYQNQERARRTLADEPEFRNIKNMVLKSALTLSEMNEAIAAEPEEQNRETIHPQESREERTKKYYQMQAQKQFLLLMKHISHMIQEDYDRKKQQIHVDKKLMRKIMEKKEAHGQKM